MDKSTKSPNTRAKAKVSNVSNKKNEKKNEKEKDVNVKAAEPDYGSQSEGDEDDDEFYTDDDEEEEDEEFDPENEDHEVLDQTEYRKFLGRLFPSKFMKEKVEKSAKEGTKQNKDIKKSKSTTKLTKATKTKVKSKPRKKQKEKEEPEELDESEEDEETEEDDDEEQRYSGKNMVNLIITVGDGKKKWEDEDDDEEYEEDEDEDEDEDESEDEDEDEEEEEEDTKHVKRKKKAQDDEEEEEDAPKTYTVDELKSIIELMTTDIEDNKKKAEEATNSVKKEYYEEKSRELFLEIKEHEKAIKKMEKQLRRSNKKEFVGLLRNKNMMNDSSFFEQKLSIDEQKHVLKELEDINKLVKIEKPYRLALIDIDMPLEHKACAMKKINMLRYMEPGGGEFYKVKNWVDTFMKIPFGKFNDMSLSINDGVEKCHEFMEKSKNILDSAVYGLNDAKMQIMQMVGQWLTNPKAIGTAIAIKGPMGTGKTTLVKEGISKILGREFSFIALGGATDSSFLEGHSYTYEGSSWGQIVEILIKSKCMNPVIYFDELDKVSDTPKGEEIIGILTHLTDTSQNTEFHDKYFSEVNFDLSKCLFIFSYNDESKINPILRDRMYRIQTKGYDAKEKNVICKQHLLPKVREQILFKEEDIQFEEGVIDHIIDTHTNKEQGVRNLKRCMEIIHSKLNLYRLMKPDTNLFEQDMSLKVEFPFKVTKDIVNKLIKRENNDMQTILSTLYI